MASGSSSSSSGRRYRGVRKRPFAAGIRDLCLKSRVIERPTGEIYDASDDVDGLFSIQFRKYVLDHNLLCCGLGEAQIYWVFHNKHQPDADSVISAYRRLAYQMNLVLVDEIRPHCLVQFWRAEEVANSANDFGERRFQLTASNQPFLLSNKFHGHERSEVLCWYRMKTRDVIITGDGRGGGPISRVFINKRMEITPDVAYYSHEEYPQRDLALSCLIKGSLIVPLSDSYGRTVGVIEFVSQSHWPLYLMVAFLSTLPGSGQRIYLDCCKGLCDQESDMLYMDRYKGLGGQYGLDEDSFRSAVSEIKEVIEVLCESFDIVNGQTWMLCKHCNSLSTSERCASSPGFIENIYLEIGSYCILREGEGVVGRAAMSSHNLFFCENVAKFSITEYPLAHFVRKYNVSASFAICLQSNHSGDQVYVLEFLLGSSYGNWGLRKKLVPILDKMRQNFRTFKAAYGGEEIGDNLAVLVVDASSPDKVETLKNEPMDLALAIGVENVEAFNLPYYLQHSIGESSGNETDDPMIGVETSFQDISMDDVPGASASTVQSEIRVTVKANYGGDFIRIQLSASSGIHELHRQVFQKLELEVDTYLVQYQDDDNDWIIIACDEDLQEFISTSHENFTLVMSIEPKRASPM